MARGKTHQLNRRRIVARRVLDDDWGERAEVSRQRARDPADNGVCIRTELLEYGAQKRSPCDAPVMSHQDAPQRLATKPGAASFIGNRQAPSPHPVVPASDHGPSDAARADDENRAIAAVVRAHAGGVRVGCEDGSAERLFVQFCGSQLGRLRRAGQCQAGGDPRKILG